jgi:hypothetical protein
MHLSGHRLALWRYRHEYLPLLRMVVPTGATVLVEAVRTKYLDAVSSGPERALERRTA